MAITIIKSTLYLDWSVITQDHMSYISEVNRWNKVNQLHIRRYATSTWKETNQISFTAQLLSHIATNFHNLKNRFSQNYFFSFEHPMWLGSPHLDTRREMGYMDRKWNNKYENWVNYAVENFPTCTVTWFYVFKHAKFIPSSVAVGEQKTICIHIWTIRQCVL
jgi:hypothetical protein